MANPEQQRSLPGFGEDSVERTDKRLTEEQVAASAVGSAVSVGQNVYVLDSHYLMFQVFHALPDIRSPAGQPVAAVHGFIQDVANLIERYHPAYVFCAFDSPLDKTFRRERYTAYKANRQEMPDELRAQVPIVRQLLDAMRVPALEYVGYEADDVLATIAREAERRNLQCFLVTGDKDCRQMLSTHTKILNIRKNEVFDTESLQRVWGIGPDQVVDFQALVGDPVDNVSGVPLIGPKTAGQLLTQYETLDNLLTHMDEVPGTKRRTNLQQAAHKVLLARELVRLATDVPLGIDWESSRLGEMDQQQIQSLCRSLGLNRLAERLAALHIAPTQSER